MQVKAFWYIKENTRAFLFGDDDVFEVWAIVLLHSTEKETAISFRHFLKVFDGCGAKGRVTTQLKKQSPRFAYFPEAQNLDLFPLFIALIVVLELWKSLLSRCFLG